VETETHGAIFVLDATGRPVHHYNPGSLSVEAAALANLPPPPSNSSGSTQLRTGSIDLLVTYARVDPPGWTLAAAEDVRAIGSMGMSVVEVLPLVLLFVALLALLAVSFGVANIVRPLQELDRRAARVAWGDFDAVKQPVGGVQEMDELRATLAQMAERIRSYQAGMRDYLSAITRAQEDERSRLAHELHDETVQALIALKQRGQMARKALEVSDGTGQSADLRRAAVRLEELERLIDGELASLRRLIGDLRPIYLEDLGFVPALEMLAKQTQERHDLNVTLDVHSETVRLAPDLELAAFRIVQQALANVADHAQARNARVGVEFSPGGLTLTVADDGRGFTPPGQPADLAREGHFGLMGMHERVLLYGGHLEIKAAPGQGATITAWLPIRQE
jgi:signal transduction histidine kinase